MTRDQLRLILAWSRLSYGRARPGELGPWLQRRGLSANVALLTGTQARLASRELNAWRAGDEGWIATYRRYPRKERRNAARRARRLAAA